MITSSCLSNYQVNTSKQLATTAKFLNVHANVQKTFTAISSFINMHKDDESFLSCTVKVDTLAKKRGVSVRTILRHTKTLAEKGIIVVITNSSRNNAGLPERLPNSYLVMPDVIDSLIGDYMARVKIVKEKTLKRIKDIRDKALAVIAKRKENATVSTTSVLDDDSVTLSQECNKQDKELVPAEPELSLDDAIISIHNDFAKYAIYENRDHAFLTLPKSHFIDTNNGIVYNVLNKNERNIAGFIKGSDGYYSLLEMTLLYFGNVTDKAVDEISPLAQSMIDEVKTLFLAK
ncbi:helix-turn-helix domain-containing protein [Photobacterium aquimaris]|uniref:Helix-turn-helix type 11 domain-containing protein n=1 Tax=Photobacterium aquimaris TaxID=512643 RepID=A0A2T3HWS2_9GAMM|nr:helix-turn-helix domain-containing protein [Photobacterium aquimaris]OBU21827.1 hypothetical protein AYY21_15945 [Photobacterium aquimaris]PQJ37147.1 hypothetical protein BTN98_18575 [Photobacterium aquimaris]PSU03454.1 hypothetical protein C0W81_11850 [Photobacterium aquimaris]